MGKNHISGKSFLEKRYTLDFKLRSKLELDKLELLTLALHERF